MDFFSDLDDIVFDFGSISPASPAWDENYDLFSIHNFSPLFHQSPPLPSSALDGDITLDEQEDLTIKRSPSLQLPQQPEGQREGVELNPPPQQPPLPSSAPPDRPITYVVDPEASVNQDARMIQATQDPEWRAVFHLVGPNVRTFTTSCSSGLSNRGEAPASQNLLSNETPNIIGKKRGRPAKNPNPPQSTEWRAVFDLVVLDTITFTTSSSSGLSIHDEAPDEAHPNDARFSTIRSRSFPP